MSRQKAFAVKDALANQFVGGSIALSEVGETFDLKAALDKGGGVIVTDDERVIEVLSSNDALKAVPIPSEPPRVKEPRGKEAS